MQLLPATRICQVSVVFITFSRALSCYETWWYNPLVYRRLSVSQWINVFVLFCCLLLPGDPGTGASNYQRQWAVHCPFCWHCCFRYSSVFLSEGTGVLVQCVLCSALNTHHSWRTLVFSSKNTSLANDAQCQALFVVFLKSFLNLDFCSVFTLLHVGLYCLFHVHCWPKGGCHGS